MLSEITKIIHKMHDITYVSITDSCRHYLCTVPTHKIFYAQNFRILGQFCLLEFAIYSRMNCAFPLEKVRSPLIYNSIWKYIRFRLVFNEYLWKSLENLYNEGVIVMGFFLQSLGYF